MRLVYPNGYRKFDHHFGDTLMRFDATHPFLLSVLDTIWCINMIFSTFHSTSKPIWPYLRRGKVSTFSDLNTSLAASGIGSFTIKSLLGDFRGGNLNCCASPSKCPSQKQQPLTLDCSLVLVSASTLLPFAVSTLIFMF